MNVLIIRYRLECKIRLKKRQNNQISHMIYIRQGSMPSLLNIVSPFMHSSMLYKLKYSLVSNPSNRNKIEVFDKDTNQTTYYNSIREAAIALNCNHTAILYNIKYKKKKSILAVLSSPTEVKIYTNSNTSKNKIFSENKQKSGLYM